MRIMIALLFLFPMLLHANKAPDEFKKLLIGDTDPRGKVIRINNFDLRSPWALWQNQSGTIMRYEQIYDDYGCYFLDIAPDAITSKNSCVIRRLWSCDKTALKYNRSYIMAAVIKTDFNRKENDLNLLFQTFDKDGNSIPPDPEKGLPHKSEGPDGWQRVEFEITPFSDKKMITANIALRYMGIAKQKDFTFKIADFALIELPPKPLMPYAKGEGVTFPGGPGNLPMTVESAIADGKQITITTTGATYTILTDKNKIRCEQRIDNQRELSEFTLSVNLENLEILRQDSKDCVLVNKDVNIGVSFDSVMIIAPRKNMKITMKNLFGGEWNRINNGAVLNIDDFGGMEVLPDIPPGSGRKAKLTLSPADLDFRNWDIFNTDSLSKAKPGWESTWELSPGERLFVSVMPAREFDWKKSFESNWFSSRIKQIDDPEKFYRRANPFVTDWIIWDAVAKQWSNSDYQGNLIPSDEKLLYDHVNAIHNVSKRALIYLSYFFYCERDPDKYISEVKRWKETYGLDGIYSDGLDGWFWVNSYEVMRRMRELFKDGTLIIHDSHPQDRKAPVFCHTYADITLLAECVKSESGPNWPYPRYVVSQFRKANCLGSIKGDKWKLSPEQKECVTEQDLINLVYNGRNRPGTQDYQKKYLPALAKLKSLWEAKGKKAFFYDRYYLPMAQSLTGLKIGRTGMPISTITEKNGGQEIRLHSESPDAITYYTLDKSLPDQKTTKYTNPITLERGGMIKAISIREGLEPSRILTIEYTGDGVIIER